MPFACQTDHDLKSTVQITVRRLSITVTTDSDFTDMFHDSLAGLGAVVRGADFIDAKGLAQLVQRSTSQEATTGPVVPQKHNLDIFGTRGNFEET